MEEEARVEVAGRAEWRVWLAANHRTAKGVWLVTPKRRTGKPSVPYEEAVEEALCFGWIDGRFRPVDDDHSMQWFAPRRPKSTWARSNKERVERLTAAGLMTESGLEAVAVARANGSWTSLDDIDNLVMPEDLATALEARPGARENYEAWTVSTRRMALAWVTQAKRPATRAGRVEQVAGAAERRERLLDVLTRRDR